MTMSQSDSEAGGLQPFLESKFGTCLLRSVRAAQKYLDHTTVNNIMQRISKIRTIDNAIDEFQFLVLVLVGKIEVLSKSIIMDVDKEDYQILEKSLQKAEADIRSHVKIQQQLRIYTEGVESKMEQLENQLQLRTSKYAKLYEAVKVMDGQKKQLKKKLKEYEIKLRDKDNEERDGRIPRHKHSYIVSESSHHESQSSIERIYLDKGRATRIKNFLNQSSDKKYKKQSAVSQSKSKKLHTEIQITAVNLHPQKQQPPRKQDKEFTQTLKIKLYGQKQARSGKYLKNSTEDTGKRKQTRSNSVCS